MKKKVLLIDDSLENLSLFSTILNLGGFEVEVKENGEEALAYLNGLIKQNKNLPSVIVTDVSMPKMDGFELCYLIKNTPKYSKIPVVIFTAIYPEFAKQMEETVNPDAILLKPIGANDLVETVRKCSK